MPQVSKYPVSKEVQERMFEIFWETIAGLENAQKASEFFHDLLTPTEKIMLAKRLAIALLLIKGYDYRSIVNTLKVSPTTIGNVRLWLQTAGSGYRKAVEKIIKSEKQEEFFEKIEEVISKFIPPPPGTDWAKARREEHTNRRARRQKRTAL